MWCKVCASRLELLEKSVRCDVHWKGIKKEKTSAQNSCESIDTALFRDTEEKTGARAAGGSGD